MSEVGRVEFEGMSHELAARLNQAVADFAAEKGLQYDAASMLRQSGVDLSNTVTDVLMFGCDMWPAENEDAKGVVLPFKRPARLAKASKIGSAIATTANVVGAFVATTLIAAATTETFSFPGLPVIAEAIYAKNSPDRYTRIVESRGQYFRITLAHQGDEPHHVVHVVSEEVIPRAELVTLGVRVDDDRTKMAGVIED